jgi:hypothetical protein
MHSPHVVKQVPAAGEAVSRNGAVASLEKAEVGVVSVAVKSMGFALMTEEASIGRELKLSIHAARGPAAVGLEMRVQVFTV